MASLSYSLHLTNCNNMKKTPSANANVVNFVISCTMQHSSQNNIKVVVNGATKEIGRASIVVVTIAREMELAGTIDNHLVGQNAGEICDMEEPLEVPILNDLTIVLGSISQSKATSVVVDFTNPSSVYDNVKQVLSLTVLNPVAATFGLRSVVYVPKLQLDTVRAISVFCEKASMGCLVVPTLSIGSVLLLKSRLPQTRGAQDLIAAAEPGASQQQQ